MAREEERYCFTYSNLRKLTGLTNDALRQQRSRKKFDPNDLESTVLWLVENSNDSFRRQIVARLTGIDLTKQR